MYCIAVGWEGNWTGVFFFCTFFASCWLGWTITLHQQIVVNKKDGWGAYGMRYLGLKKTLLNGMELSNNVEITQKFHHFEVIF
jgi:hypothetical protein